MKFLKLSLFVTLVGFCLLVMAFSMYAGNMNHNERALSIALLATLPICMGAGFVSVSMKTKAQFRFPDSANFAVIVVAFIVAVIHITVLILMGSEWAMEGCAGRIFVLCTNGEVNVLAVLAIEVAVNMLFAYYYWSLWKHSGVINASKAAISRPARVVSHETDEFYFGGEV